MRTTITTAALKEELASRECQLIDVRSTSEFAAGHVPGAINIPMDQVDARLPDLGRSSLLLICHSGHRANLVANRLRAGGKAVCVVEGGTQAWKDAGYPVVRCLKSSWSLERQVRLGAGLMVLTGLLLAWRLGTAWLGLAAFVGAGLTFAGLTDICAMGMLLAKMPWNRACKPVSVPQITDAANGSMTA